MIPEKVMKIVQSKFMSKYQGLTDEQWAILGPLPASEASSVRGRHPVHDDRPVPNGILWVLRTGAAWAGLPERFPSSSTCCRRFGKWGKTGVFRNIPEALARDPEERGATNLSECFIDGTFVVAKKGRKSGKDQAGQGYEAHGHCRRFRSSARPAHGFCQPS